MAFPRKTKQPIAVNSRSQIDLSCQHVTTADWMQFNVVKSLEVVPEANYNIRHELFSRLEPMPVPTFGRAEIRNKVFFVPYRTVWSPWNDFINDVPHTFEDSSVAIPQSVPFTYMYVLVQALLDEKYSRLVGSSESHDFTYYNQSGTPLNYKFTTLGRQVYKMLISLGYKIVFDARANLVVSLMPIYCTARIYVDWFYTSQYANDADSAWLISILQQNVNHEDLGTASLAYSDLIRIFSIISYVFYDIDKFTSVWDNPDGPNTGLSSSYSITDPSDPGDVSVTTQISEYSGTSSIVGNITQFAVNALRKLSDYMKRNQIAGARSLDRYLSRFGVKLPSEKLNRSVYLGGYEQQLQFGDVTSTADTEGANLGSYAGKGLSYGNGSYEFNSNGEYGMLIIVSIVIPHVTYYQGLNREVLHTSRLDFWTPEFDGLGVQAMSRAEVYVPTDRSELPDDDVSGLNGVFGFVPRYAEYKTPFDVISGDYFVKSLSVGKDSWYLARDISNLIQDPGYDGFVHDYQFIKGDDASQYNRIFYVPGQLSDHFNMIHNFVIKCSFPGKSLFDNYEFENEDKSKKVTLDVDGTTLN